MKVAVMQPYFFPYLGYYQLIAAVDRFVVWDDVQYIQRGWVNRNRILLNGEPVYINLPVEKAPQTAYINERKVADLNAAAPKMLGQLHSAYRKAPQYLAASPVYLHDIASPARMYADYPKAKLIVICRDPIERSLSHYNYYSSKDSNFGKKPENKIDQRSVEQAFDDDMNGLETRPFFRYCRMSCYAQQISHFLAKYPREQVMFVDLHDLEAHVIDSLLDIAAFLGLPSADEFRHIAVSNDKVDSQKSFEKADDKQFKRFNSLEYNIPISEELEARLKQFFKPDVEQLQAISGRKFSWADKYLH